MYDPLYEEAEKIALEVGFIRVSTLQRRMRVGYTRAARLVDIMVERGFCEKEPCDNTGRRNLIAAEQRLQSDKSGVDTAPENQPSN
jgi:S-DNA-T family DNA segregation ATPase FtsK/SpoIIIE